MKRLCCYVIVGLVTAAAIGVPLGLRESHPDSSPPPAPGQIIVSDQFPIGQDIDGVIQTP